MGFGESLSNKKGAVDLNITSTYIPWSSVAEEDPK